MGQIDLDFLEARLSDEIENLVLRVPQAPDRGCWVAARGNLALLPSGRVLANATAPVTAPTVEAMRYLVKSAGFYPEDFKYLSLKAYLERVLASKTRILGANK